MSTAFLSSDQIAHLLAALTSQQGEVGQRCPLCKQYSSLVVQHQCDTTEQEAAYALSLIFEELRSDFAGAVPQFRQAVAILAALQPGQGRGGLGASQLASLCRTLHEQPTQVLVLALYGYVVARAQPHLPPGLGLVPMK